MSAPPRVAVTLTQCWHPVPGGTATSVLRLTRALQSSRHADVIGVTSRGDVRRPGSLLPGRLPPAPFTPDVPLRAVPWPLPLLYDVWTRGLGPAVDAAAGAVDVLHLTVPVRVPRPKVPLVATVHDVFPLTDPERLTERGARLTRRGLEWIREHSRVVMVPSQSVAAEAEAVGFSAERLRVVPWGVDVEVPPASVTDVVRRRHGIEGPYVLFVGTIEPRKNLGALLSAMTKLGRGDVTLVLAGPMGWGEFPSDELAAVPGPVVMPGFVPEHELAALERGADVFCFPSLAEGFGMPVLEAMAAGAAVVTSSGTATEEVAGDAALLVPPRDHAALADAIATLLDEPATAERLRASALRRAGEFTWDRTAELVAGVYDEVTG